MDIAEFMTVFRDSGIRSWIDWDLIELSNHIVVEKFSRSKTLLGALETVWYVCNDGSLGDWRNQDARRVSVKEAAKIPGLPTASSSNYIARLQTSINAGGWPYQIVLPCYSIDDTRWLILDGNHRAIAAFRSKRKVRLLIFALSGPLDPFILPDLLHEVKRDLPPDAWARSCNNIDVKFRRANPDER